MSDTHAAVIAKLFTPMHPQDFRYLEHRVMRVVCGMCGMPLNNKQFSYEAAVRSGTSINDALAQVDITRPCCRVEMMTAGRAPAYGHFAPDPPQFTPITHLSALEAPVYVTRGAATAPVPEDAPVGCPVPPWWGASQRATDALAEAASTRFARPAWHSGHGHSSGTGAPLVGMTDNDLEAATQAALAVSIGAAGAAATAAATSLALNAPKPSSLPVPTTARSSARVL